ncbi:MAG: hypothetical protein R3283_08210 [Balneolaceae bacterium]|nr:hypothetical protein [Balneolaceae bacterium]
MNHSSSHTDESLVVRLHTILTRFLFVLMAVEWVVLLVQKRWLPLFLVSIIILTLYAPVVFRKRLGLELPAEFHLTAVLFIFASFYLGEVQDFYYRIWWWDIILHVSAGFLMGIVGFLMVYILNESKRVELHMTTGFIAVFAFTFAISIGSIWEIFEFSMDQLAGANMQKQMFNDPSGLTDTMWDLIVNAFGALFISVIGYLYLKGEKSFFLRRWIRKFIDKNPRLFNN